VLAGRVLYHGFAQMCFQHMRKAPRASLETLPSIAQVRPARAGPYRTACRSASANTAAGTLPNAKSPLPNIDALTRRLIPQKRTAAESLNLDAHLAITNLMVEGIRPLL